MAGQNALIADIRLRLSSIRAAGPSVKGWTSMLSQTIEYALRAVMHLAALPPDHTATSESIAEHTLVPRGYLSKVLRDLVVAELIDSRRGPNGGFVLARPPGRITMLDVVSAVDPLKRIERCPLGNPMHISLCPLHRRLDDAISMVEREFRGTSLAELLESAASVAGKCGRLTAPTIRKDE